MHRDEFELTLLLMGIICTKQDSAKRSFVVYKCGENTIIIHMEHTLKHSRIWTSKSTYVGRPVGYFAIIEYVKTLL